jgi:HD-GYP domain-containing protein (c-di-GMP phosphodiesterase class II)
LGGPEFPAPARFVAAHSLNCACVMARIAGVREQARDLVLAALLHDVGMLGVDAELLADAGRLDAERQRVLQRHADAGAERITARLPGLARLAEAAAGHHERADGTGYPAGLSGEQVSPMARLVAAVDVYAALCAPRPHRPALDPRAALTDVLLLAERGRLDRHAADRLLALGPYPAGAVVELADGWTAVVVAAADPRTDMQAAGRPLVALVADPDARPLHTPRFVDLAAAGSTNVVRTLGPADRLRRLGRSYPEWI